MVTEGAVLRGLQRPPRVHHHGDGRTPASSGCGTSSTRSGSARWAAPVVGLATDDSHNYLETAEKAEPRSRLGDGARGETGPWIANRFDGSRALLRDVRRAVARRAPRRRPDHDRDRARGGRDATARSSSARAAATTRRASRASTTGGASSAAATARISARCWRRWRERLRSTASAETSCTCARGSSRVGSRRTATGKGSTSGRGRSRSWCGRAASRVHGRAPLFVHTETRSIRRSRGGAETRGDC